MNADKLNYFRIAKEWNDTYLDKLKIINALFRGSKNSLSLISLNRETAELGYTVNINDNPEMLIDNFTPSYSSPDNTHTKGEKELQAWVIKYALHNNWFLPFEDKLKFITSELAIEIKNPNNILGILIKERKNKIVNDILAIDKNYNLCIIELKSDRDNDVKKQTKDFEKIIILKEYKFINDLVSINRKMWNGKFRKISIWPFSEGNVQKNQFPDVEEWSYTYNQVKNEYVFLRTNR